MKSPLIHNVAFHIGPVPVTDTVVTTWIVMAVLVAAAMIFARRISPKPGRSQTLIEILVSSFQSQIRETIRADPAPYLPLIVTLFLFILAANWSALLPGVEPPTAQLETDAALGLVVFGAIIWFGIRARGALGYLKSFAEPSPLLAPLNIIESLTRIFSMIVRLFGNVMSGVFVIGIVVALAGLLVPIPLMALHLLTGAIQAYIFTVLSMVFIGSAVSGESAAQGSSSP